MRCPSCGTDNAPDSRFCGGCGTRFAASGQRVAPTQKITDDASFPQRQLAPGAGSAVPVTAPGVVAPRATSATPHLPPGAPPAPRPLAGGSAAPARPPNALLAPAPRAPEAVAPGAPAPTPRSSARPQAVVVDDSRNAARGGVNGPLIDDPARSLPVAARRPWALILLVLVIDLGLAAAGVWMLVRGLGDRASRAAPARSGGLTPHATRAAADGSAPMGASLPGPS